MILVSIFIRFFVVITTLQILFFLFKNKVKQVLNQFLFDK